MRALEADRVLGRILRFPLRLVPNGTVVPILATSARGKRWITGSGPHSCWLGFNERAMRAEWTQIVREGVVVWDVGANVGSYTILSSVLVGPRGHVIAIEPDATNIRYLRQHVELNDLPNVTVLEVAVTERQGTVRFMRHADRLQGHVAEEGDVSVAARTWMICGTTSVSWDHRA